MHPLLHEASYGNRDAQRELIEEFSPALSRFVDRRLGRRLHRFISASDLCQETFRRVFQGLGTLPEHADLGLFRGRLLKTAGWVIAQKAQEASRFAGESAHGKEALVTPSGTSNGMGPVTAVDELRWLEELCDRLPDAYREVVRRRVHGQTFEAIADHMQLEVETARKRFYRAIVELRRLIDARRRSGS